MYRHLEFILFFLDCICHALAFLLNVMTPNLPNCQKSVKQRIEDKMLIQRLSPLNPSSWSLKWKFGRHLYRRLVWQPLYLHLSLLASLELVSWKRENFCFYYIVFHLSDFCGRLRFSWSIRVHFSLINAVCK